MAIRFSLSLPHEPEAGVLARQAVRAHLPGVLSSCALADVELAVSELVSNAVQHGAGDIHLVVAADGSCVTGEVTDEGRGFERRLRDDTGLEGVGGLGLFIVDQLTERWGVREGTSRVWFQIPVDGAGDPASAAHARV